MKLLKKIVHILTILIVLFIVIGFILPQQQHVERSLEIDAPAEKIYPHLADPRMFSKWSPWSSIDPEMKTEFTGPASGEGAGMSWQSNNRSVGNGSWTITKAVENKSLEVAMDFGDQGGATSFFNLEPSNGKTKITWGFDTDAGMNPVMRWMGLMMDKLVGAEYAKGLETLRKLVEPG
ncbi:hypothetical protein GQR58_021207 [Nymphon striatum]|nr:hypothetical protein GQR58_021207 [Nymphon striatum]